MANPTPSPAKPDPKNDDNKAHNNQSSGKACKCGGSGRIKINGVDSDCDGPGPH